MQHFLQTIVWRHRKENLKKCSLRGLETRSDFKFYTYPGLLPDLSDYVVLTMDAPEIGMQDARFGLFIIDATWRYAEVMMRQIDHQKLKLRSIPGHFRTAYPRNQESCLDPERGLASIEAIYLAYRLMGRKDESLLNNYYWKDVFLKKNNL